MIELFLKCVPLLILAFMSFSIWINDYIKVTFARLIPSVILLFIGVAIAKSSYAKSGVILLMLLFFLIVVFKRDHSIIPLARVLASIWQGFLIYNIYDSGVFGIYELLFITSIILHVQMFPENWQSCGPVARSRVRSLCYVKTGAQ